MRTLQFLLATLLLIAIPLGINAQDKFIKSDFKVRKNINLAMVDKDAVGGMLNANKSFAEIQVFDFGDEGTTIILNFRIETRDCGEDGKPAIIEGTHSWSGKRMMLGHTSNESGEELYVVMYGNQPCGTNALTKTRVNDGQPIWFLALSDSPEGSNFVGENLIGLDVDALRTKFKDFPGRLSGGKNMGEYMVYELLSIGTRKRYKSNGDYYYEANANTPYARFYFKNGKLEKWLFLEK